jgi:hypothetical protein
MSVCSTTETASPCEPLGLVAGTAARQHPGLHLAPQHLGQQVVARAELARPAGPGLGLVELAEPVVRLSEQGRCPGQIASLAELRVEPATLQAVAHRRGMVAGQELELDGVEAEDAREDDAATALRLRGPLLAEDRASLLEAAEHGRRPTGGTTSSPRKT